MPPILWIFPFHLSHPRCHLWKGQKNEVKIVRFWPHFSPVFCHNTTTSCGVNHLFLLVTTIRHHYHCFNVRWDRDFILHGKKVTPQFYHYMSIAYLLPLLVDSHPIYEISPHIKRLYFFHRLQINNRNFQI